MHKEHNKTTWNEQTICWFTQQLVSMVFIQECSWPLCHKFSFVHNHNERKVC